MKIPFSIKKNSIRKHRLPGLLLVAFCLSSVFVPAQPKDLFRWVVNPKKSEFADAAGRHKPSVKGGNVVEDPSGSYLQLGQEADNQITLPDDGKFAFKDGLTFEIRIYFEEAPPQTGTSLALKVGSFSWDLVRSKPHVSWMSFPNEPIATTNPQQFNYYPVGTELINGLMEVPLKKWMTLTFAYDEALGSITTCIDGLVDRQRYRYRGAEPLSCDGKSPFTFLKGFKNCRIQWLSLRTGRPKLAPPSLEVYANPLPYSGKLQVTFDHIDPALKLPIEVTLLTEKASGQAFILSRMQLISHERKDTLFDLPTWKNSLHTLMVNATSDSKPVYQKNFRFANPKPTGKTRIAPDLSMVNGAKNFFPILMYHAQPEDFGQLSQMGFNVIYNNFNLLGAPPEILLKKSLDSAQKHNLLLLAAANGDWGKLKPVSVAKDHPATLGWYGADEPYGDLSRLVESYNTLKMLDPNLPVLVVMNNYSRLQEAAMGTDILGVDPYPIPKISLRMVFDATQAAVKAVGGAKPVWTTIPDYDEKIPTAEELRCMAWLAIAGGANGLGIFEWDHRVPNKPGGWLMKDSAKQVSNLAQVIGELKGLESVLLMPSAPTQPIQMKVNPAVHVLLKEEGEKRYLVVVNDSRQAESATLHFGKGLNANLSDVSALKTVGNMRVENGMLALQVPPLGVLVFEVAGN